MNTPKNMRLKPGGKHNFIDQCAVFSSKKTKTIRVGEKNDYLRRRVIINMYVSRD